MIMIIIMIIIIMIIIIKVYSTKAYPPRPGGRPSRAARRSAARRPGPLPPATWTHGWSKHGFEQNTITFKHGYYKSVLFAIWGCFDGILPKPCLLQPCFHVAGTWCRSRTHDIHYIISYHIITYHTQLYIILRYNMLFITLLLLSLSLLLLSLL